MPELDEWWGYPAALTIIAGSAYVLYRYLRAQRWI
jgi:Mg2+ and Co2+ transporter CorA